MKKPLQRDLFGSEIASEKDAEKPKKMLPPPRQETSLQIINTPYKVEKLSMYETWITNPQNYR